MEKAAGDIDVSDRYNKESKISLDKAGKYRRKINPVNRCLPDKDIGHVKNGIMSRVKSELNLRIMKGYKNIDLNLIE